MLKVVVDYVRDTARLFDRDLEIVPSEDVAEMVERKEWTLECIGVLYNGDVELILTKEDMELNVGYDEIELVPVADRPFLYAVEERLYSEDWIETCECCGPQPVYEEHGYATKYLTSNVEKAIEFIRTNEDIDTDDLCINVVYLDEEIFNGGIDQ